jgi:hypothetical protein
MMTTFDGADPVLRAVVETGCMCQTTEGLGYAPDADWQAGFATVAVHADGSPSFDLATWRGETLTWRGQQWTRRRRPPRPA